MPDSSAARSRARGTRHDEMQREGDRRALREPEQDHPCEFTADRLPQEAAEGNGVQRDRSDQ
ncbi:MAG: hypothetical protein ACRDWE_01765, partial [Acidimicrobiales bacterium]